MKRVEAVGKNVQQAIESGLSMLHATLDQVDVEVVSEGGLFKKAKVVLTIAEEDKKDTVENEIVEVVSEKIAEPIKDESTESTNVESTAKAEERKEILSKSMEYIKGYLEHIEYLLNITGDIEIQEKSRDIYVSMLGEYVSVLIGYHGESLIALQNMLSNLVYNKFGYKGRVFLDIAGYKDKRAETLEAFAKRMAYSVQKSKKSCSLEPMNSYERRIIHTALQDMEHIATHSDGVEPKRHLVIDYID